MHPFPGLIIVSQDVVEILREHACTGVEFIPVRVKKPAPSINLYELAINGNAWRVSISEEDIILSDCCGRYQFPLPNSIVNVDETRWDKSDFFVLDMNPNRVFITNKVVAALENLSPTLITYED